MKYDAIVVPSGGVREGGRLPLWVERRLDLACELRGDASIIALSAGTPHRPPPRDEKGFPIFESSAGALYLMRAGVPADRIFVETHSWDTIGNAWFSRMIHTETMGLTRLLIITSEFHARRTEAAFRWVYGLTPLPFPVELAFLSTPNDGLTASEIAARSEREAQSLDTLEALAKEIRTTADFHRWLFTRHGAYRADCAAFRETALSDEVTRTY